MKYFNNDIIFKLNILDNQIFNDDIVSKIFFYKKNTNNSYKIFNLFFLFIFSLFVLFFIGFVGKPSYNSFINLR